MDTNTMSCYLPLRFASACLPFVPHAKHLYGLLTMLKTHHILDTQQCKTIMTLSDHTGKQIIRDISKLFSFKRIFKQCLFTISHCRLEFFVTFSFAAKKIFLFIVLFSTLNCQVKSSQVKIQFYSFTRCIWDHRNILRIENRQRHKLKVIK
jgi:hypothetical protein